MKKISIIVLFIVILVFSLCGCNNKQTEKLPEKVLEEIRYMDSVLLSMLNNLNNISFEQYKVVTEKISSGSSESSAEGNSEKEGSSEDSSSQKQSQDSGGSGSGTSKDTGTTAKLKAESVLIGSKDPDWEKMKMNIEKLNEIWSGIISDMYQIGANSDDILKFSENLNISITAITAENKEDSMKNLANLYQYLSKFTDAVSQNQVTRNLGSTKAQIINAYSKIETEDWTGITTDLQRAEEYYKNILNESENTKKEYNRNKVFVALKEFQNAVGMQNKDVLYMKYKNLIEEIVML